MADAMVIASLRAEIAQIRAEKDAEISKLRYDVALERGEKERLAKTAKLRQVAQALIMANHMSVAAAATRFGFVGLSSDASASASGNACLAAAKKCCQKARLRPTRFSHMRDCDS